MSQSALAIAQRRTWYQSLPFFYGWVNVVLASFAMTATLPGRTHGLGLVTEPLLQDLNIDRVSFGWINFTGSLLGAAFCLPIGWLIDRLGVRSVLVAVTTALGLSVVGMSNVDGPGALLFWLILVRGFGQSALSIASMAAIGKWFGRRAGIAMGVFAVLLTFGFIGSVLGMGAVVEQWGWRLAWLRLGLCVLLLAPVFWLFVRSTPETCGLLADEPKLADSNSLSTSHDFTFLQALVTPAFWIVVLGASAFILVWSGATLFNESILAEQGLDKSIADRTLAVLTGVGLLSNLACGALATRTRIVKLLGVGLVFLVIGLATFPLIKGAAGVYLYATAIGLSGGIVTVVFFAAWGHLFGRGQLGRIQGAGQLATVLASASGPVLMAQSHAWLGAYSPMFVGLALAVGFLALFAFLTPTPRLRTAP